VRKQPCCPDCGGSNTGENAVPSKSLCRPCKRARDRAYRLEHLEQAKQRAKDYAKANREKLREYHKEYYLENSDTAKERTKLWREQNLERAKATRRERYARQKDKHRAAYKKWAAENPEKAKASAANSLHRRRARQRDADIREIKRKEMERVFSKGCAFPGCTNTNLQLDHIIPLFRGGRHAIGNLQALCGSHNASKGARLWIEFKQMKGVA
jgi:5-methylcytosine-specific restriction endonuclease McrA